MHESLNTPPGGLLGEASSLEMVRQLESQRVASGARSVRMVVYPTPGGCPCGAQVGGADAVSTPRTVEGICPRETTVLAEAGGQSSLMLLLCLRRLLDDGSVCALQVGFVRSPAAMLEIARLASQPAPLLLWAAGLLEREHLRQALAAVEEYRRAELRQAITAQDEEREWIALEVHDRIAQTLASIFQQLQAVEGMTRSYPEIRQAVVQSSLLCREAIREARNIMNDLRPPILEDLGLVPTMQEELSRLAEETHCQVMQELTFGGRPPWAVELTLYRIFKEAVVNTRRHSGATAVGVSLRAHGAGVSLAYSDNGAGFDVEEALKKKRVGGLLSMRRRAELAGGALRLESQPGRGARVTVWLPLPPSDAGENVQIWPLS